MARHQNGIIVIVWSYDTLPGVYDALRIHNHFEGGTSYMPTNTIYSLAQLTTSNSMELTPSREATSCSVTQEFPKILRNAKVHYRAHKCPTLLPVLSQINPIHMQLYYL
jgi:hypothetical protein